MFWISQEKVQPIPSALKAEVRITILRPSDTRSFNRGEKTPLPWQENLCLLRGKIITNTLKTLLFSLSLI